MLTGVTANSGSLQQTVSLCTEMMSVYSKLRQQSPENVVHFKGLGGFLGFFLGGLLLLFCLGGRGARKSC